MNSFGGPPRRVRTISTMDDEILMLMRASSGEDRRTTMYTQNKMASIVAEEKLYRGAAGLEGKAYKDDGVITSPKNKPPLKRRNSTGTIYIQHTMSAQDNNLTIQCVCTVIRAHMIQAAKENIEPIEKYDIFKDAAYVQVKGKDSKDSNPMALVSAALHYVHVLSVHV